MDFEITEEQRMFRDMARKFAEQEILPSLKENERQEIFDPAIIKKWPPKDCWLRICLRSMAGWGSIMSLRL